MSYHLIQTDTYKEDYAYSDIQNQQRATRFCDQLELNPLQVGKPLGFKWFREKKFNGNRLYYLVYEEWQAVLLVGMSTKKDQSNTISKIRSMIPEYHTFVYSYLKENGLLGGSTQYA